VVLLSTAEGATGSPYDSRPIETDGWIACEASGRLYTGLEYRRAKGGPE